VSAAADPVVSATGPSADDPGFQGGRPADGRPPPGPALIAAGAAVALLFAAPFAYLLVRNVTFASEVVDVLAGGAAVDPLRNTLVLAVAVSLSAALLGTTIAWLAIRTDVPARRVLTVAAPLPLVFPSFVGAAALQAAVAPNGMLEELVPALAGRLPRFDGFVGAWLVLTLFTYPYVYLPVAARLAGMPRSLEESARVLGRRPIAVFRTVVMPQASSAIWAGALLVFLYTVSDYGAVAALRYNTLTVEIFSSGIYNEPKAAGLGLVLAVVALAVVIAERAAASRRPAVETARGRAGLLVPLGRWRWPAFGFVVVVLTNALFGPLSVLGYWAWRGLTRTGQADPAAELIVPTLNTTALGLGTAVITVAIVLPLAYLTVRHRSRVGSVSNALVVGGFALPGLVIALALVRWVLDVPLLGGLYQTLVILVAAYVIHFGSQAMRAAQVATSTVPARLDDAARMLGAGRWRRLRTVELPIMLPGLIAGGGLVLLSTMKELPATLLLRPTSVDTLAVHIWSAREAARWADTGLASIVLVALSAVLTWWLVARRVERLA
jgi:iron(III) transport system permease protein